MPTQVQELAEQWAERHPELRARIMRAVALVPECSYIGEDTWQVEGSGGAVYFVGVDPAGKSSTCTCEDSRRGHHCKHRLACALAWTLARKERVQG